MYTSMTISGIARDRPVAILYGLIIVSLTALPPLPPLLQDQGYHQFADQRELFEIPNFWNVRRSNVDRLTLRLACGIDGTEMGPRCVLE
jgi:hypothetical protein